eukprot:6339083-Ditylum_brightwellii.AAC.1
MNSVNHKDPKACGILIGVDAHKYKHNYFGCKAVSHAIFNHLNEDMATKAKSNSLAYLAQAAKTCGKLNIIYFRNRKMMYVPFSTKASEMNALLKVHIHNAVSEPAEWRGMRVTGIIKGLTKEQLSEIADHELIETIDYNSSSLTDTEAYIDLHTSDHFQTNRALAAALP